MHGFFSLNSSQILQAIDVLDATELGSVHDPALPVFEDSDLAVGGLFSERIFGPTGQRNDHWAKIVLPCPCVHPGLVETIGARLKLTIEEVSAVVRYEAWLEDGKVIFPPGHPGMNVPIPDHLFNQAGLLPWKWPPNPKKEWLKIDSDQRVKMSDEWWTLDQWYGPLDRNALQPIPAEQTESILQNSGPKGLLTALGSQHSSLISTAVPVPPLPKPPLIGAMGGLVVTPASRRPFAVFLNRVSRANRLIELRAPEVIVAHECHLLQVALEELIGPRRPEPEGATFDLEKPIFSEVSFDHFLVGLHKEHVFIDVGAETMILSLRGTVVQKFDSPNLFYDYTLGDYVVFGGSGNTFVFELAGDWIEGKVPSEVPSLIKSGQLVHAGGCVSELCDNHTACGRFGLDYLGGEDDADSVLMQITRYDGKIQLYQASDHFVPNRPYSPRAIAYHETKDVWRWVDVDEYDEDCLFENGRVLTTFDSALRIACFDDAANRLLTVVDTTVTIFDIIEHGVEQIASFELPSR